MANQENGRCPDILDIRLAYRQGARINPCLKGCKKTPEVCGETDDGLSYDPDTNGAICLTRREPVIIFASPPRRRKIARGLKRFKTRLSSILSR